MKLCSKCGIEKATAEFHSDRSKKDGLRTTCKPCKKVSDKSYAKANASKISDQRRERYLANYERERLQQTTYAKQNRDTLNACQRKWKSLNKGKVNAATRKRQASKLKATPPWLTEKQLHDITVVYTACSNVTDRTGKPHHVDHIVPLQGKNICGLHVPWNLAILPAAMNMAKSNTH